MLYRSLLIVTAVLLGSAATASAVDLQSHKPRFHWKTDAEGEKWLYDGEMPVGKLFGGYTDTKLMSRIARPISLHHLRLIPGGPLFIADGESCGPLCLSWRKHLIFFMKIDKLEVNEEDPGRFRLYVKSHDVGLRKDQPDQASYQPNNMVEESWLEVTYDPGLPSYVFDVRTRLTVQPGRAQAINARDFRGLEFADILPAECNVPLARKRYHDYVYQGRDGIYYRLPQDKNRGPEKRNVLYANDGTMAFLLEQQGNPVLELVGDTGRNSFSEICHAMYDVHFKFSKKKQRQLLEAGKPLEAHFRLYSIGEAAGKKMLDRSRWDPKLKLPDPDGETAARREQMRKLLVRYTASNFDSEGKWVGKTTPPELRERLWYAKAFLSGPKSEGELVRLGNRIIGGSKFRAGHFSELAAVLLLLKYDDRLEDGARQALRGYLTEFAKEPQLPHFNGVNDNMPAMATASALLVGELFGNQSLLDAGRQRLEEVVALLDRRGVLSEYNSPTYTPHSLQAFAELANYATDPQVRQQALQVEGRIWLDILTHYHPGTYKMAGPHSRAYLYDCVAHSSSIYYVLYGLLGDAMKVNPTQTTFSRKMGDPREVIHHDPPFMQVIGYDLMSADYHCPARLVDFALNRPFPFEVKATTEVSSFPEIFPHPGPSRRYPGGVGVIHTTMMPDYALGTTTREFATGTSTNSFYVVYRKRRPVATQADVGVVFSKYLSNDKVPQHSNSYPSRDNEVQLLDEGRKIAFHAGPTALVLYTPKLFCAKGAKSLKLAVLFPAHYRTVEALWLGGKEVAIENTEDRVLAETPAPSDVIIKDGPVFIGLRPVALTDHGRQAAVRVEMLNRFLMISFYNYEGPSRDFTPEQLDRTSNGFVAEIGTLDEIGNMEEFRQRLLSATLEDVTSGHDRSVQYQRNGLSFECVYRPQTEEIRRALLNGSPFEQPRFSATGLPLDFLP